MEYYVIIDNDPIITHYGETLTSKKIIIQKKLNGLLDGGKFYFPPSIPG